MSAGAQAFGLDRARLREHLLNEYGEALGLDPFADGGLAASLVRRLLDAQDAGAIGAPENAEVMAYALCDALLICVRESALAPASRAFHRQLASYSIETRYLTDGSASFEECCAALEECLARASELVQPLRLLQAAEAQRA